MSKRRRNKRSQPVVVEAAVVGRSEIAEMIGDNAHVQLFEYTVETGSKSCLPLLRQIASRLDRSVRVASTIMGTYWYVNIMDIGE